MIWLARVLCVCGALATLAVVVVEVSLSRAGQVRVYTDDVEEYAATAHYEIAGVPFRLPLVALKDYRRIHPLVVYPAGPSPSDFAEARTAFVAAVSDPSRPRHVDELAVKLGHYGTLYEVRDARLMCPIFEQEWPRAMCNSRSPLNRALPGELVFYNVVLQAEEGAGVNGRDRFLSPLRPLDGKVTTVCETVHDERE